MSSHPECFKPQGGRGGLALREEHHLVCVCGVGDLFCQLNGGEEEFKGQVSFACGILPSARFYILPSRILFHSNRCLIPEKTSSEDKTRSSQRPFQSHLS